DGGVPLRGAAGPGGGAGRPDRAVALARALQEAGHLPAGVPPGQERLVAGAGEPAGEGTFQRGPRGERAGPGGLAAPARLLGAAPRRALDGRRPAGRGEAALTPRSTVHCPLSTVSRAGATRPSVDRGPWTVDRGPWTKGDRD